MQRYTQFTLLMMFVLVLVLVFTYQGLQQQSAAACDRARARETFRDEPATLQDRVESIIYGMYEIAVNPARNANDVNTTYQLWYSTMMKRGLPDSYVVPELFEKLKTLIDKREFSPDVVASVIQPFYDAESPRPTPGAMYAFRPVCLNY